MRISVLTVAFVLLTTLPSHAVLIGDFSGLEELIDKADAIVTLRIDAHIAPRTGPNLFSTHECFIYQTLKGPIPPKERIQLRLMDTRHASATPFVLSSTHLIFLAKKLTPAEPTEYRTLACEGANVRLTHLGHEKPPAGNTVAEQVRAVIKRSMEQRKKEHAKELAFLERMRGTGQAAAADDDMQLQIQGRTHSGEVFTLTGQEALPYVVQMNDSRSLKRLIAEGHDINRPMSTGWTYLKFAIASRNLDIVKVLLANGADVNAIHPKHPLTALDIVLGWRYHPERHQLVELLLKHDAKVSTEDRHRPKSVSERLADEATEAELLLAVRRLEKIAVERRSDSLAVRALAGNAWNGCQAAVEALEKATKAGNRHARDALDTYRAAKGNTLTQSLDDADSLDR